MVPDGKITDTDRVHMGHPQPSCTYGITNSFKYKNWTASFLITAQTGGKIYGALYRAFDRQGMGTSVNVLRKWKNMWFSESDPGDSIHHVHGDRVSTKSMIAAGCTAATSSS